MSKRIAGAVAGAFMLAAPSIAQAQGVKVGLVATLTGPQAGIGKEIVDGFNLGVKHSGGKLGGAATEVITVDDQFKPDVGKSLAERLVQRDKVDIVTGVIFSNILLAMVQPVLDAKVFLISANAGPSELAGKDCDPYFFAASWQNDNAHEAMGQYMQSKGIKRAYLMAPNYPAGKDALTGMKRFFKGEVVAEIYTQMGQLDYAAELAQLRAAKPDATYIFYPGGMGINYVKQYSQLGLTKDVPLYGPSYSFDQTILPATGDAALGVYSTTFWSERLKNPANDKFVADFEAEHKRIPSPYAAQAYDTARLIDSAVKAVGGDMKKKDEFRAALKAAKFDSVRGPFKFNTNQFPIQNFYVTEVVKDEKGRLVNDIRGTVFTDHKDAYASQCKMK